MRVALAGSRPVAALVGVADAAGEVDGPEGDRDDRVGVGPHALREAGVGRHAEGDDGDPGHRSSAGARARRAPDGAPLEERVDQDDVGAQLADLAGHLPAVGHHLDEAQQGWPRSISRTWAATSGTSSTRTRRSGRSDVLGVHGRLVRQQPGRRLSRRALFERAGLGAAGVIRRDRRGAPGRDAEGSARGSPAAPASSTGGAAAAAVEQLEARIDGRHGADASARSWAPRPRSRRSRASGGAGAVVRGAGTSVSPVPERETVTRPARGRNAYGGTGRTRRWSVAGGRGCGCRGRGGASPGRPAVSPGRPRGRRRRGRRR